MVRGEAAAAAAATPKQAATCFGTAGREEADPRTAVMLIDTVHAGDGLPRRHPVQATAEVALVEGGPQNRQVPPQHPEQAADTAAGPSSSSASRSSGGAASSASRASGARPRMGVMEAMDEPGSQEGTIVAWDAASAAVLTAASAAATGEAEGAGGSSLVSHTSATWRTWSSFSPPLSIGGARGPDAAAGSGIGPVSCSVPPGGRRRSEHGGHDLGPHAGWGPSGGGDDGWSDAVWMGVAPCPAGGRRGRSTHRTWRTDDRAAGSEREGVHAQGPGASSAKGRAARRRRALCWRCASAGHLAHQCMADGPLLRPREACAARAFRAGPAADG